MRLFCCYAFTGEDSEVVEKRMKMVVDSLKEQGHDVYCFLFDERRHELNGMKEIFLHAFTQLKNYDALVAVVSSDRRSEGQLMEIGAALSQGIPVYLLQHKTAAEKSYLPDLAHKTIVWETIEELKNGLAHLSQPD